MERPFVIYYFLFFIRLLRYLSVLFLPPVPPPPSHISLAFFHFPGPSLSPHLLPFIIPFPTQANRDPISRNRRVYYGGDHFCNLKTRLISFPRFPLVAFFFLPTIRSRSADTIPCQSFLWPPRSRAAPAFLFFKEKTNRHSGLN